MITRAITSSVKYLQIHQETNGSFLSFSTPNPLSFKKALKLHSLFSTALILSCLNHLEETHDIAIIKQKAVSFLFTQKSQHWSFNYWVKDSKEAKSMPYPDDLDDTFCALAALYEYNSSSIDGDAMAHIVTILTATEINEGGPYQTWLIPKTVEKQWQDVDIAINSNIAYFLSLQKIELPKINHLIEERIIADDFSSQYYPSFYPIVYFISRFYKGDYAERLKNMLLDKRQNNGSWENPLYTALAIIALLNFETSPNKIKKSVEYLLQKQSNDKWQPYVFCIDPARGGKTYYAGSSALTTVFCLEALEKYFKVLTSHSVKTTKSSKLKLIQNQIIMRVQQRFSGLTKELNDQAKNIFSTILKIDAKNQITLLPYFFKTALDENNAVISDKHLISLGAANVYGWMAYTIYDHLLDEEGEPTTLSFANIALRELTRIFYDIARETDGYWELFQEIMDQLDGANAWEISYCRVKIKNEKINLQKVTLPNFGNYEKLAQKSFGHALGPLAILFLLGYNKESSEVKNLCQFFKHYLIARQLNDDAHDWEKDFRMGHITPVVAMLLKKSKRKYNTKKINLPFSLLIPHMQELFWHKIIVDLCDIILENLHLARKALNALSIVIHPHIFQELLTSLDQSAKEALDERKKTLAFIDTYQKHTQSKL